MSTQWRSAVRDNAVATCEAFQVANPTLAHRVYRKRPASIGDTRSIFVDSIGEQIRHDSGTRQRTAEVSIVVARHLADNEETADDLEELADALIDYLSDNPHAFGANTVQEPVRDAEVEIAEGTVYIPGISITCRALIMEGRS